MMPWTTDDVPDQTGRMAAVTGANTGIGYETARVLAGKGAHVVLACRTTGKAAAAATRIRGERPSGAVEPMELDLASLDSVRRFADAFRLRHDRLHLVINNAGVMMTPFGRTEDGFERQLGVNHLGHFALTGLLLDRLREAGETRVVTVSSGAHRRGTLDFDDLMYDEGGYSPFAAYARSKLANLVFTFELQRRLDTAGESTLAVAVHPGFARTELTRYVEHRTLARLLLPLFSPFAQSARMGALPTLRAATDPDVEGGEYYGPDGFMEQRGWPVQVEASAAARDPVTARRLWEVSERLTGVAYDL